MCLNGEKLKGFYTMDFVFRVRGGGFRTQPPRNMRDYWITGLPNLSKLDFYRRGTQGQQKVL